jgi:hypothetical protein
MCSSALQRLFISIKHLAISLPEKGLLSLVRVVCRAVIGHLQMRAQVALKRNFPIKCSRHTLSLSQLGERCSACSWVMICSLHTGLTILQLQGSALQEFTALAGTEAKSKGKTPEHCQQHFPKRPTLVVTDISTVLQQARAA